MIKNNHRLLLSLCLFAGGAYLLLHSYVGEKTHAAAADVGPMFYPRILLWTWTVLAAAMCLQALRKPEALTPLPNRAALLWTIALTCVFGFFMEYTGFFIISVAFCFLYPFLQGYRRIPVLVSFCLLYTLVVWYLFNNVLFIFLPEMVWLQGVM